MSYLLLYIFIHFYLLISLSVSVSVSVSLELFSALSSVSGAWSYGNLFAKTLLAQDTPCWLGKIFPELWRISIIRSRENDKIYSNFFLSLSFFSLFVNPSSFHSIFSMCVCVCVWVCAIIFCEIFPLFLPLKNSSSFLFYISPLTYPHSSPSTFAPSYSILYSFNFPSLIIQPHPLFLEALLMFSHIGFSIFRFTILWLLFLGIFFLLLCFLGFFFPDYCRSIFLFICLFFFFPTLIIFYVSLFNWFHVSDGHFLSSYPIYISIFLSFKKLSW